MYLFPLCIIFIVQTPFLAMIQINVNRLLNLTVCQILPQGQGSKQDQEFHLAGDVDGPVPLMPSITPPVLPIFHSHQPYGYLLVHICKETYLDIY